VSARIGTLAIFGALVVGACAGVGSKQTSWTAAEADSAGAPAPAEQAAGDAAGPPPTRRPGLGTTWGENVYSEVHNARFVRVSDSPFASVALHYNDAGGVQAQTDYRGGEQAVYAYTPHRGLTISLTDQHGNVLPGLVAGGRTLVVGREGERYNIVIENTTGGRYELVATVDGLDVLDGRHGDLRKRGYLIDPHGRIVIDGFRRTDTAVAAFRFGKVEESYAARTSGDRNVGVIGIAFFAERGSLWTSDELRRRENANPFPGDRTYARPPR